MTVHVFYDEKSGTTYSLDDDGLVLPADATDEQRREAWRATAEVHAYWLLFPDA